MTWWAFLITAAVGIFVGWCAERLFKASREGSEALAGARDLALRQMTTMEVKVRGHCIHDPERRCTGLNRPDSCGLCEFGWVDTTPGKVESPRPWPDPHSGPADEPKPSAPKYKTKRITYLIDQSGGFTKHPPKEVNGYAVELPEPLHRLRIAVRLERPGFWVADHYDSGARIPSKGATTRAGAIAAAAEKLSEKLESGGLRKALDKIGYGWCFDEAFGEESAGRKFVDYGPR